MILKVAIILVGAIIILIALVFLVGLLLPQNHTAKRTARFGRPAPEIWDAINDYPAQVKWRTGIREMKRLEDRDGHEIWKEVRGRGDSITYMVIEREPPRMLKSKIINNRQFGGTWTWVIAPDGEDPGGACTLTITEDGEIYNPIFRVVAKFIMGYTGVMTQYLTDLGRHLDAGAQFTD